MNLISLGTAFGIVVFIFQQGHGSEAIWGIKATDAMISWIPLMIFAFLSGSRWTTRCSSSRASARPTTTRRHEKAIHRARADGQARDKRSARARVRVLRALDRAGPDIKQFGIGLAAGILIDATLIRSVLVPSFMKLMGSWNWWFPEGVARVLRVPAGRRVPEVGLTLSSSRPSGCPRRRGSSSRACSCSPRGRRGRGGGDRRDADRPGGRRDVRRRGFAAPGGCAIFAVGTDNIDFAAARARGDRGDTDHDRRAHRGDG